MSWRIHNIFVNIHVRGLKWTVTGNAYNKLCYFCIIYFAIIQSGPEVGWSINKIHRETRRKFLYYQWNIHNCSKLDSPCSTHNSHYCDTILHMDWRNGFWEFPLTFRHRVSCILGQAFHYSPENAFYVFNQQIYFIVWYLLDRTSLI